MQVLRRAKTLQRQISSLSNPARNFHSTTMAAAKLDINSKVRMNSGYDMPLLGYGVYQTPPKTAQEITAYAIANGYRHVDSAAGYKNEAECAAAVVASGIPREDIFFTTKVPPGEISYEGAKKNVELSLEKCKALGYIDLMLLHAPFGGRENRLGAWDALVESLASGKIRSIGVSNYGVKHLDELEAHMKEREAKQPGSGGVLSVNQVELHPWLARPDIDAWCKKRGVIMQAYSPLARATRLGEDPVKGIADRLGKTEAQIMLRWSLQKDFVPLPKSETRKRILENAALYDFELSPEDMKALDTGAYDVSAWDPTVTED